MEKTTANRRLHLPCLDGETKLFFLSECNRDVSTTRKLKGSANFGKVLPIKLTSYSAVQISSF